MNRKFKLSKIAILLAGCGLVNGCGGGDDKTSSSSLYTYDYSNQPICFDSDLDGICSPTETSAFYLDELISANKGSYLIDHSDYILTAPIHAQIVSPFTTLIQNEVLFNPQLDGSEQRAKTYLQNVFGDKYDIDFNQLDHSHGPEDATKQLLMSFRYALSLTGTSRYLKLAAAVDNMISNRSFDITTTLTQADLDGSYIDLKHRYLTKSTYSLNTLVAPSTISMNEQSGMLLALVKKEHLLQIDTRAGTSATFLPTLTSASTPDITNVTNGNDDQCTRLGLDDQQCAILTLLYGDNDDHDYEDDDDDDDDHHHDDDDDDDHDYSDDKAINTGGSQQASRIILAVQGQRKQSAYLLSQPSLQGSHAVTNTCNSNGDYGIFLTKLGTNSQATPLPLSLIIDSYSSASGKKKKPPVRPPIITPPSIPVSSANCKNNNISVLMPIYQQGMMAAVFTNSSNQLAELQLLSSADLIPTGLSYPLLSAQPSLVLNKQQTQLLVVQEIGPSAIVLDAKTLSYHTEIMKTGVKQAAFVNQDQELLLSDNSATLYWFSLGQQNAELARLTLKGNVTRLVSSPNGKYSAALTNERIYVIDNATRSVITSAAYQLTTVLGMNMLDDKIIVARSGGLDYFQFESLLGSPIQIGYQLLSKNLITQCGQGSGTPLQASTLGQLLRMSDATDADSDNFDNIDLQWLPDGVRVISEISGVILTGQFRNKLINVKKTF